MISTKSFLKVIVLTALSLGSTVAVSDDTEVYLGNNLASTVQPNLVFIIDTSGSMASDVTLYNSSYDPAVTYTGTCSSSRIYWSSGGTPPSCSTSDYIDASAFVCKSGLTAMGSTGFYTDRAGRYNIDTRRGRDRWDRLSSSVHNEWVECKGDWGIHGKTDTSTNLYPADYNNDDNSDPGYRADTNGAINWDSTGRTYTFYSGNYLNYRYSPGTTTTKTRLEIVQEVFSNLMDSVSGINVAVMRYDDKSSSYNKGGYFVTPMLPLTDANRQSFKDAVNAFTPGGYTPLAETMYEAYLFYKGSAVLFGNSTSPGTNVAGVLNPTDSTQYKSPIEYSCQKNFVILLTDGDPTYDTDADSAIQGLPGFSTVTGSASCTGDCLDELAQYMYKKDCSSLTDTQNVISYYIGFTTNQTLLNDAATKGGGKYYTADDTAGLTDAFTQILTDILAINTTFIAPAVSVNAYNRFTHRDELYYALFKPNARPNWNGNVKRFKLGDINGTTGIVDANGDPAVDPNTGFFKTTATSFWTLASEAPDGDDVKKGGAASLQALPREVYTYTGTAAPNNELLTAASNDLNENNALITKTMLGDAAMTDATRTDILKWARGVDVMDDNSNGDFTDARRHMGDPLHSKPVLITYGGTALNPDITLYAATNEGYLHAIDTSDGSETFAFMPQELLGNLQTLYDDASSNSHPYGLDGPLTYWFNDVNGNGLLYDTSNVLETGEFTYIYQGMRRGGRNYYALDVTNRSSPILKWEIKGGTGDFSELGQTWSSATKATIKLNGVSKDVLIFGGGYDTTEDSATTPVNDSVGRAIYMVDAATGTKIWQAGPAGTGNISGGDPDLILPAMTNSIPSDITVLDTNFDGFADRLYFGDMRGQVWRIDFDNAGNTGASNLASGAVIATLGGSTAEDNRRFYYAPDVSISQDGSYLNIAIGSGYRAHPLETAAHDAFYMLHDYDPFAIPADNNSDGVPDYTTLTSSNLYDATANLIGQGNSGQQTAAKLALSSSSGWYIWMQEVAGDPTSFIGEKVLAKSVSLYGVVMFTTYTPIASAAGSCSPSQGTARAYLLNIEDATPYYDNNSSGGDLTREDRVYDLVRGGIPPEVSILFPSSGDTTRCVGAECGVPGPNRARAPEKFYWIQE